MKRAIAAPVLAMAWAASIPAPPAEAPARPAQRLRYTPADREVGRFQYVPFTVPPGATRLTVRVAYEAAGGANVLDLGLFEPGPLDLGTPAFRGWSGASTSEITIGRRAATLGYWPGPLPAGEWRLMLGLYKVAAAGVEVTVTSETSSVPDEGPAPTVAVRPAGPLRTGPAWFSGALHLHTVHSDGRLTPAEVCRRAREAGLDFVAITDHNNTTHQLDAVEEPGLLRIVGEEVTTPGGHALVWGLGGARDYVDFRIIPGDERIKDLVRAVVDRGAVFAVAHPGGECPGCAWEHLVPDGVSAVEITEDGRPSTGTWDALLRRGRRVTAIGSSDWHAPDRSVAAASVRVWADELSEKAILQGIRAGRVVVMADGVTPPPVLVARSGGENARVGDTLTVDRGTSVAVEVSTPPTLARGRVDLVWNGEVADVATTAVGQPARFTQEVDGDGTLRAHVYAADGRPAAITNVVYVKARPVPPRKR